MLVGAFALSFFFREHTLDAVREIYSAWCAELMFFTFVGILIAIITLRDPRGEAFEERMRILYGRRPIPDAVMNYNHMQIRKLAAFYTRARRTIV
jgi:hypothetical protein